MADVQAFYAKEMERHGHDKKTFSIEVDANDKPIIHVVKGKRNLAAYISNNDLIETDLPAQLRNKDPLKNDVIDPALKGEALVMRGMSRWPL